MRRFLIVPLLALLLVSCSKPNTNIGVFIEGLVLDMETNLILEGATIEVYTNDKIVSGISDENGYFSLQELAIGDYALIISKEGYASRIQQVRAAQELLIYDTGLDIVKSYMFGLSPLEEKIEITVYRRVSGGFPVAAANFPYKINTGDINSVIEGTTDSKGVITMENVPKSFTLIIDHEHNGVRYEFSNNVNMSYNNYVVISGYETFLNLGIVEANILDEDGVPRLDFPINQPIVIEFTVPVNIETSVIDLRENGWNSVTAEYTWSADNTIVTINPPSSLNSGTEYRIELQMRAMDSDQPLYTNIEFYTAP